MNITHTKNIIKLIETYLVFRLLICKNKWRIMSDSSMIIVSIPKNLGQKCKKI